MFPVFREHSSPNAALLFTSGTSHGEAIGDTEVSLYITAVWILGNIANSYTIMDSKLCHTSKAMLPVDYTRYGSRSCDR